MTLRFPLGRMFLSAAHTEAEIEATIAAFIATTPTLHRNAA
jgi:hypothetical protein